MELMLRKAEREVHAAVLQHVQDVIENKQHSRLLILTEMAAVAKAFPQGCYEETVFHRGFDPRA